VKSSPRQYVNSRIKVKASISTPVDEDLDGVEAASDEDKVESSSLAG